MRILAGIFYLLAFIGIMAVAHFVPATPPAPAKPAPTIEPEPIPEPEIEPIPVEEIIDEAMQSKLKNTNFEIKQLEGLIFVQTEKMANLNRKLDLITDSNLALKNENSMIARRLAKIEAQPAPIEQSAEAEATPESPEIEPETEETPPPALPVPRTQSVKFKLGSMDFSEPALETLRKVAEGMTLNKEVVATLKGSTSGFGPSLGTGRAQAVKSKLAEFGIATERVTASDQSGDNGDLVQLSFKKK